MKRIKRYVYAMHKNQYIQEYSNANVWENYSIYFHPDVSQLNVECLNVIQGIYILLRSYSVL